jgi:hypothetical protein
MVEVVPRIRTAALCSASVGNICVTSLIDQLQVEDVNCLERVFAEHRRQWGPANVSLTLVKHRVPIPGPATRARLEAMHTDSDDVPVACVVLDGDGFWAAASRGVLASIALVSKRSPHAVRTVGEALVWVARRLPAGAPDVRTFAPEIEEFWRQHLASVS